MSGLRATSPSGRAAGRERGVCVVHGAAGTASGAGARHRRGAGQAGGAGGESSPRYAGQCLDTSGGAEGPSGAGREQTFMSTRQHRDRERARRVQADQKRERRLARAGTLPPSVSEPSPAASQRCAARVSSPGGDRAGDPIQANAPPARDVAAAGLPSGAARAHACKPLRRAVPLKRGRRPGPIEWRISAPSGAAGRPRGRSTLSGRRLDSPSGRPLPAAPSPPAGRQAGAARGRQPCISPRSDPGLQSSLGPLRGACP